jgi:hypothetical protein
LTQPSSLDVLGLNVSGYVTVVSTVRVLIQVKKRRRERVGPEGRKRIEEKRRKIEIRRAGELTRR